MDALVRSSPRRNEATGCEWRSFARSLFFLVCADTSGTTDGRGVYLADAGVRASTLHPRPHRHRHHPRCRRRRRRRRRRRLLLTKTTHLHLRSYHLLYSALYLRPRRRHRETPTQSSSSSWSSGVSSMTIASSSQVSSPRRHAQPNYYIPTSSSPSHVASIERWRRRQRRRRWWFLSSRRRVFSSLALEKSVRALFATLSHVAPTRRDVTMTRRLDGNLPLVFSALLTFGEFFFFFFFFSHRL